MTNRTKFTLISISIALLFFSCSPKIIPLKGYNQIRQSNSLVSFESINYDSAISINPGTVVKSNLNLSDAVLVYKDTIFSNYKIFSFSVSPHKKFHIKIKSYCGSDCLGFTKYMLNPEFAIFNNDGQRVPIHSKSIHFYTDPVGPFTLIKECDFSSGNASTFFIVVYADNEHLEENMYRTLSSSPYFKDTYVPLMIGGFVNISLVGNFSILIEE